MINTANQQEAFEKLSRLKVGALFMEQGTGKTKLALDLISSKMHKIDYALWICPYSLKNEIEAERKKWHPELQLNVVGCESIGSSDRIYLSTLDAVKTSRAFIVVDESLKIKNLSAKRTRRILDMSYHATYKLILNGTPVSKNILDMWAQMEFLSPKILNMSFREFKDTYCEYYTRGKMKGRVCGQHNIPHLTSKIAPYVFECKLDINTEKDYTKVSYYTDRNAYNEYKKEMFDLYYDELEDDLNFNAFVMKLQRFYTSHSNREKRIEKLLDDIKDQAVVFVRFTSSIPEGAKRITGEENSSRRAEIIQDFKDKKFQALWITYGCGAFGLNLQFCKHIIFAEHTWDYAQRAQAEARIYRMGQGDRAFFHDMLCAEVGLEDMIFDCLGKKESLLDRLKINLQNANDKEAVKKWVDAL